MTTAAELNRARFDPHGGPDDDQTMSVAEAARLLGRDRTRVYALLRSGDLVAAPADEDGAAPLRIVRASLDRWLVAGGARGAPLSPRNAWALIGLASGDQPFSSAAWASSNARKRYPARARGSGAKNSSIWRPACAGEQR